jgi:magnesium-dependent phosphatase 1
MLWGGGAPFKQSSQQPNNTLIDSAGVTCSLMGDVARAWADLHKRMQSGEAVLVGVASRCDEPRWGRECLQKFIVAEGLSMMDVVTPERCEIYKGSKRDHFHALHKKTGIPFERMCFFDDDMSNIRDVSSLGVHCFHTPDGVTWALYSKGLIACGAAASQ